MGCHFLLQGIFLTQGLNSNLLGLLHRQDSLPLSHLGSITKLCLTLCDPMDNSPPGSSVHGILEARILEWVAIKLTSLMSPALAGRFFTTEPPGKPLEYSQDWHFQHLRFISGRVQSHRLPKTVQFNLPRGMPLCLWTLEWNQPRRHWQAISQLLGLFPEKTLHHITAQASLGSLVDLCYISSFAG